MFSRRRKCPFSSHKNAHTIDRTHTGTIIVEGNLKCILQHTRTGLAHASHIWSLNFKYNVTLRKKAFYYAMPSPRDCIILDYSVVRNKNATRAQNF